MTDIVMDRVWNSQGQAGSGLGWVGFLPILKVGFGFLQGFYYEIGKFLKKLNDNYFSFIFFQFLKFVKYFIKRLSN